MVKLADFGLMKKECLNGMTRCGTFGYMSPERRSGETYDHKTDIFSVGIIGIELFFKEVSNQQIQKCIEGKDELPVCKMPLVSMILELMVNEKPEARPEARKILDFMTKAPSKSYFNRKTVESSRMGKSSLMEEHFRAFFGAKKCLNSV